MDMGEFFENVRAGLPDMEFVYFAQDGGVDALLVLNACRVGCADVSGYAGPMVFVTPEGINDWPVHETALLPETIRRMIDIDASL